MSFYAVSSTSNCIASSQHHIASDVANASELHTRFSKRDLSTYSYNLRFLGSFGLVGPDGRWIEVTRKKSIALLALLATGTNGERWRSWLQEKLWGSLEPQCSQAALRREIYYLRRLGNVYQIPLLIANYRVVKLNISVVNIDFLSREVDEYDEFLEGFSLLGEPEFGYWLKKTRQNISKSMTINSNISARAAALRGHL